MMYLPLDKWMQDDKSGLPVTPSMNALPDTSASSGVRTAPSLRDNLRNREAR
jgi:hypothetical protein